MKLFTIIIIIPTILCVLATGARAKPFAPPDTGRAAKCKVSGDPVCGEHGICSPNLAVKTNHSCRCDEKWFTLSDPTAKPCDTEKKSQSLAAWLQFFFGWLGVGAWILNWTLFAAAPFIALGAFIVLGCIVTCACDEENSKGPVYCMACVWGTVVVAMWVATFFYIVTDCYSNVEFNGVDVGVPCF